MRSPKKLVADQVGGETRREKSSLERTRGLVRTLSRTSTTTKRTQESPQSGTAAPGTPHQSSWHLQCDPRLPQRHMGLHPRSGVVSLRLQASAQQRPRHVAGSTVWCRRRHHPLGDEENITALAGRMGSQPRRRPEDLRRHRRSGRPDRRCSEGRHSSTADRHRRQDPGGLT